MKQTIDKEFWDNMEFLLQESENIGLYTYQNFNESPEMFCGHKITSTPYKK